MNEERGKLNGLEAFLANCDEESQADDLADLRKMGVNVDAFMKRVDATVQAGYAEQALNVSPWCIITYDF